MSKSLQAADLNLVLSIGALVVSIVAAGFAALQVKVAADQNEAAERHNKVTVAPLIRVIPYAEGKGGRNGLFVSNVGLGPATISGFSATAGAINASGFEADHWPEILAAAGAIPMCFATGWPRAGSVVRAGEELPLVYITRAEGFETCHAEMIKLMGGSGHSSFS